MHNELVRGSVGGQAPWREHLHKLQAIERSLRHMLNKELAHGFVGWQATWREHLCKLAAMVRALLYALKQGLARSIVGWRAFYLYTISPKQPPPPGTRRTCATWQRAARRWCSIATPLSQRSCPC